MLGPVLLLMASWAATAETQPATLPSAPLAPAALNLFERDWVLMNWALKFYDKDRDILISPAEAQAAAAAFRERADSDHDGRVTPEEYRAAREFIQARD
jgi:hypothetical protein